MVGRPRADFVSLSYSGKTNSRSSVPTLRSVRMRVAVPPGGVVAWRLLCSTASCGKRAVPLCWPMKPNERSKRWPKNVVVGTQPEPSP